jgi:hypothetical protein
MVSRNKALMNAKQDGVGRALTVLSRMKGSVALMG